MNFSEIGADVPLFVENQDSLVRGIGDITIKQLFNQNNNYEKNKNNSNKERYWLQAKN